MAKRIFSSVLLWLIVAGSLWYFRTIGGVVLIGLIAALTLHEFYKLMAGAGLAPFGNLGVAFGALITISPWLEQRYQLEAGHLLAAAVILFSVRILAEREPQHRVEALAGTLFGLVYVGLLLSYLVRIVIINPAQPSQGLLLFVWLVAVAKFCDVGALLAGLAIGRHKMAPQISPKKSWEGAVGGVLLSMAVGAFLAWLWADHLPGQMTPLIAAVISAPIALVGIVSDLIESVIKRRAAIKDSGGLIPGIGGFFDVCDSLILTAPLGYFFFGFLQ